MAHLTTDSSLVDVIQNTFHAELANAIIFILQQDIGQYFKGNTTQDPLIVFQKDGKLPFEKFITEAKLPKEYCNALLTSLKELGFVIN